MWWRPENETNHTRGTVKTSASCLTIWSKQGLNWTGLQNSTFIDSHAGINSNVTDSGVRDQKRVGSDTNCSGGHLLVQPCPSVNWQRVSFSTALQYQSASFLKQRVIRYRNSHWKIYRDGHKFKKELSCSGDPHAVTINLQCGISTFIQP